jgi:uncharacterized damage-inducible protein DinB
MRRTVLILLAVATPAFAQQQQGAAAANASVSAAKNVWMLTSNFLQRAAEQMPESLYSFRPTAQVRSFGEIVGHVADAQYMFCGAALGEPARTESFEKSAATKAALVQAVKDASAYCQRAYALTDAASTASITLFGSMPATKMMALIMNGAHDYEHYGNLVTYFRLKGMVPPSSQGQ